VAERRVVVIGFVHPAGCEGDCCNVDAYFDDLATGEPWDTDYRPPMGRGVARFISSTRATDARPARALSGDPMIAPEAIQGGRDAWRSGATSSTSSHAGRVAANPGTPPLLPHGGVPTPLTSIEPPACDDAGGS
jgi:hypothetical protein